jgi:hypothetical protein
MPLPHANLWYVFCIVWFKISLNIFGWSLISSVGGGKGHDKNLLQFIINLQFTIILYIHVSVYIGHNYIGLFVYR